MKHGWKARILALLLCLAMVAVLLPMRVQAAGTEGTDTLEAVESGTLAGETGDATEPIVDTITMVAGEVKEGFLPAGTPTIQAVGEDAIAWVDQAGNLNALRAGTTVISVSRKVKRGKFVTDTYTVNVEPYSDGTDIVGNLKLLARYNDSMQFYDGHVYLLFTSYQDGIEVAVPDLYGGYEISDQYYEDIRADIYNGSNHTGNDADKYFTFRDDMTSMTLNRGEIVTIGMYRGFDLSVPQAALGTIKNSSVWARLSAAGKTAVVENMFRYLHEGKLSTDEAVARFKTILAEVGADYSMLMDGVVEGGVCFNRELYNQKLEWDQFENVTYELDITRSQLASLFGHLQGNLNKFNIMKNSCATAALRAWNAAVGTRDGKNTAYWLSAEGSGIYAFVDAPKGVRDAIVSRLPGYYLNNAENVAEPDAGFVDETGHVYVSAPEPVAPAVYTYADESIMVDDARSKLGTLVSTAFAGRVPSYNKDAQEIVVSVAAASRGEATEVTGITFTVNGTSATLNDSTALPDGLWLKVPTASEEVIVVDANENTLPSVLANGFVSFHVAALPATFTVVNGSGLATGILKTERIGMEGVQAEVEVYTKEGGKKILGAREEVPAGTNIYVKTNFYDVDGDYDVNHVLAEISLNGTSLFNAESFDEDEGAYFAAMPSGYGDLRITFAEATIQEKQGVIVQRFVGDVLRVDDFVELASENPLVRKDAVGWKISDGEDILTGDAKELRMTGSGTAVLYATAQGNEDISVMVLVDIFTSREDVAQVTYDKSTGDMVNVFSWQEGEEVGDLNYASYVGASEYVSKGSILGFYVKTETSYALSEFKINGKDARISDTYVANEDVEIHAEGTPAIVENMPARIELKEKGDTYQLKAKVAYKGRKNKKRKVYDPSIRYVSSDSLLAVDENGKITVVGEVPANGQLVYVTAYAGSSNDQVFAVTKVAVGDYVGDRIVGKLTISARRITEDEPVAHGALTFQTYEDLDLLVSYYHYYRPNDKMNALLADYEANKEKYTSDPALYNNNELGLTDRESYYDVLAEGAFSDPKTISLKAGEAISVSNYGYGGTQLETVLHALENSTLSAMSANAQELIRRMRAYIADRSLDGPVTFDALLAVIKEMYMYSKILGDNPADGVTDGGLAVNREMYNQFRRNDSQFPNNYYQIEITADELAALKAYLSNPVNNHYSLFTKNCASGVVDAWNTTLSDHPDLQLKANYTGFAKDPESLYFELGLLAKKKGLEGTSGKDFYPRSFAWIVPESITLNETDLTLETEFSFQLTAEVLPENAKDRSVAWTSGDASVAVVDENGIVTGVSAGKTAIHAKTTNGLEAVCAVTVKDSEADAILLNYTSKALNVGLTVQLQTYVFPEDAVDAAVTWESSNPQVAAVSKDGLVKAVRCGSCEITARTKSGLEASCKIKVKQKYVYQAEKNGVYRYSVSLNTMKQLEEEGWTYKKVFRAAGASTKKVYWIYNKSTKRYQYTTNRTLAKKARESGHKAGFAFYASDKKTVPVYELCKEGKQPTFFYTMKAAEAKKMMKEGWTYEKIAFYGEEKGVA